MRRLLAVLGFCLLSTNAFAVQSLAVRMLVTAPTIPTSSYAAAYFKQLATNGCAPTTYRWRAAVGTIIASLQSANIIQTMDGFYPLGATDACAAKVNAAAPAANALTVSGTCPFTAYVGYAGDAATCGVAMSSALSALTNFQQNSAHLGAWVAAITATSHNPIVGEPAAINNASLALGSGVNGRTTRLNNTSVFNDSPIGMPGYISGDRNNASTINTYFNGSSLTAGGSQVSSARSGQVLTLFRNGAGGFGDGQVFEFDVGAALTTAQEQTVALALARAFPGQAPH